MPNEQGEYPFKYQDTVIIVEKYDAMREQNVNFKTAEHHPGWNVRLHFDNGICYIYSDLEIDGLELVGTNVRPGE